MKFRLRRIVSHHFGCFIRFCTFGICILWTFGILDFPKRHKYLQSDSYTFKQYLETKHKIYIRENLIFLGDLRKERETYIRDKQVKLS